ncbi:TIGR00730 family Rossman fold protein [Methyloferula stellata]|uniref:LOG family protein n=1 Tax=Methyloferula stellata TaxID=876270 RepID=UPI00037ABA9D|nr:TIGR00730 family Rossman fold protein [Methyloferula stellata]
MNLIPSEAASPRRIRTICVYCGSSTGGAAHYYEAARKLGHILGKAGIGLVYGGGNLGLMGTIASAVIEAGGKVTGIIPDFLVNEKNTLKADHEQIVVPDMHTRKRLMFERADAFVALPGGVGTLEELVEQLTWVQLERHSKPVVLADISGFWRPLLALFAHMREQGFIQSHFEIRYLVAEKIEDILPMIETASAEAERRGLKKETVDPRL